MGIRHPWGLYVLVSSVSAENKGGACHPKNWLINHFPTQLRLRCSVVLCSDTACAPNWRRPASRFMSSPLAIVAHIIAVGLLTRSSIALVAEQWKLPAVNLLPSREQQASYATMFEF
jgi:hypothetical protein